MNDKNFVDEVILAHKTGEVLIFDEAGVIFENAKHKELIVNDRHKQFRQDLPKYWDRDYINRCLNLVKNNRHKMLFKLLWFSGVRITEALNLKKMDIDFDNYTMVVKWLKSRKYNKRVVPLHPTLRDILEIFVANFKADELLFPISRQRAWQLCRKHFKGHPHQFRHSFAVNWLQCGGELFVLHKMLGHSKIQTTMEYLKIVPIDQGKELVKIIF